MDIMLDNQVERVQALRLARRLLMVAPELFPVSLARCLVAIARDGAKERDRLLRSALATLNEMGMFHCIHGKTFCVHVVVCAMFTPCFDHYIDICQSLVILV